MAACASTPSGQQPYQSGLRTSMTAIGIGISPCLGSLTQTQRAISYLRSLGTNAHIYLPGVGALNGLQAANFLMSDASTGLTAVDSIVGRVSDAMGTLGVELVTTPTGSNGWTAVPGGGSKVAGASTGSLYGAHAGSNKSQVMVVVVSAISGTLTPQIGNATGSAITATGTYQYTLTPSAGLYWYVDGTAVTTATVTVSVKEVIGIDATQPTTANKPSLRRGAVAKSPYSRDLGNGVNWPKTGVTVSNPGVANQAIVTTATTGQHFISGGGVTEVAGYLGTFAARAKPNGNDWIWIYTTSPSTSCYFNVATGAIGTKLGPCVPSIVKDGDYYICAISTVSTGGNAAFEVHTVPSDGVFNYTAAGAGTYVSAASRFVGTLTAAQILAFGGIPLTTTAPASTALGPWWWDTSGGKSIVATFPAGNESVTVIDSVSTGQVTTTAQNVVGAYSISTPTNGRIIVKGTLTAPGLALLQALANKWAGL